MVDVKDPSFPPTHSKYYPAFDYLRIILAIAVAADHAGLPVWRQSGDYAVQVFFALSGWLIGGILLHSKPHALPRFYFNRAARIWIPYLAAIVLLMAASLLKERVTAKWLEIFFYDLTFVYNFFGPPQLASYGHAMPLDGTGNHFWSICAEEQFYLLAPFLITILPAKLGKTIWFWTILSMIALVSPYWMYYGSISLGVLTSVATSRLEDIQVNRAVRLSLGIAAIAIGTASLTTFIAYRIAAPISAICIVLFFAQAGPLSRIGSFLGGVSFPMYLNHWIGLFVANAVFEKFGLRDTWPCRLTGVLFAAAIATALYLAIDRNVRKYRNRYFTISRGKTVAGVGFVLLATGILGGIAFIMAGFVPQTIDKAKLT